MLLYSDRYSDPKANAQNALEGRTHYVDDNTLRFHKSRVLSAQALANGLLFGIVTSDALDMNNTRRGFRFVIFDLFGSVIDRQDLESTFRTSAAALKAMDEAVKKLNPKALTLAAIRRQRERHGAELAELAAKVADLP